MENTTAWPGKISDLLIRLNSIAATRLFLNNLVTHEGYHILYHRKGSLPGIDARGPVDHYEIMSSANRYDDIYISIYNETNTWIPPRGYLFEYDFNLMLDAQPEYDRNEIGEQEIVVDTQYYYKPKKITGSVKRLIRRSNPVQLEDYLVFSFGTNLFIRDFPDEIINEKFNKDPDELNQILSTLKPRMKGYI